MLYEGIISMDFQEKAIQKNSWKLCHSFSI